MKAMNEIIETRKGNLGSSDAKMVAKIGRLGKVSEADKPRLAQMLGLVELKEIDTPAMQQGREVENLFYRLIAEKYGAAKSNPLYVSSAIEPKNFRVINHIDVEVENNIMLTWIEHKATKHETINQVADEYRWQLQWHWMLLRERATELELLPVLKLAWYNTATNQFEYKNIEENHSDIELLKRGIEIIDAACESFEWVKPEELPVEAMPAGVQRAIHDVAEALQKIEQLNDKVDEFKRTLLNAMLENGIKSIRNDMISITLVPESESMTIDTKRLKDEHPELVEKYQRLTKRKPYVTIKIK